MKMKLEEIPWSPLRRFMKSTSHRKIDVLRANKTDVLHATHRLWDSQCQVSSH